MSKYNKAEHNIQVIYELTETNKHTNKTTTREYNSYSFPVTGGKMKIRKAIEEKTKEIHDTLNENMSQHWTSSKSRGCTSTR